MPPDQTAAAAAHADRVITGLSKPPFGMEQTFSPFLSESEVNLNFSKGKSKKLSRKLGHVFADDASRASRFRVEMLKTLGT